MLKKILNRLRFYFEYGKYLFTIKGTESPKIMSSIETLKLISQRHLSVSRFGDGEFKWIMGIKQNSFQNDSASLSSRLREVLSSNNKGHLLCVPDRFNSLKECRYDSKVYWVGFMNKYRSAWINLLNREYVYGDTNISRLYYAHSDIKVTEESIRLWRRIWSGIDILIVEGEKTRLGVGNNLFEGCGKINRIICPATNAWDYYDDIYKSVLRFASQESLILIALGPTATVLSHDLSLAHYWAIDVGHIDIEYEWYLKKAKSKIAIEGKYTNESNENEIGLWEDENYTSQILDKIGVK